MDFEEFKKDNSKNCIIKSKIPEIARNEPCCVGIDEAGRGPVLGPMVYGICYCPLSKAEELKTTGFADSKTLTEEEREALFKELSENCHGYMGWVIDILTPNFLSNCMLQRTKCSLNEVSHNSAIGLIRLLLDSGVKVQEVYVDTVGPAEKYQDKLQKIFPEQKIVVTPKADAKFPVVSAASVCAKGTHLVVIYTQSTHLVVIYTQSTHLVVIYRQGTHLVAIYTQGTHLVAIYTQGTHLVVIYTQGTHLLVIYTQGTQLVANDIQGTHIVANYTQVTHLVAIDIHGTHQKAIDTQGTHLVAIDTQGTHLVVIYTQGTHLVAIDTQDSKTLTEEEREALFKELSENCHGYMGWVIDILTPNFLSNCMLQRTKCSLNEVSHNSAIGLIRLLLDSGVKVQEVYVDTVGPAEKYQDKLQKIFPEQKIVVTPKADAKFPVVSAASVCAKVSRDRVISAWEFSEDIIFTKETGSGYPSGYQSGGHLHTEYPSGGHLHTEYPSGVHLYTGYPSGGHLHTEYQSGGHLHTGYPSGGHLYTGYPSGGHLHTGYPSGGHLHTGYPSVGHLHTGYPIGSQ
ncbi:predicted protein [Nematostella vectensis]|uniref:Ribonuclease n=1 Tax=Nematostella vectensis TaxID=45351 RepID=A7SEB2_NEMVE|nr:predicted protein [Nematostella vectensis]|eukprot:XP_001630041.1 predicted protein [Nematostella vectensis]